MINIREDSTGDQAADELSKKGGRGMVLASLGSVGTGWRIDVAKRGLHATSIDAVTPLYA